LEEAAEWMPDLERVHLVETVDDIAFGDGGPGETEDHGHNDAEDTPDAAVQILAGRHPPFESALDARDDHWQHLLVPSLLLYAEATDNGPWDGADFLLDVADNVHVALEDLVDTDQDAVHEQRWGWHCQHCTEASM
jgi:hypothetical protein